MVRLDTHGITSFVRCLGLNPNAYFCILHFFYASSWQLADITRCWINIIRTLCQPVSINGQALLIGDGIKVSKEAKRMPGVKKLHQESDNSNKPTYILGHHFGLISLLIGAMGKLFAIPLVAELHDGVTELRRFQGKDPPRVNGEEKVSIITLMLNLAIRVAQHLPGPSFIVLDAFFAVRTTFLIAKECLSSDGTRLLHVITRAKRNIVAFTDPPQLLEGQKRKRGRPRIRGEKVKLFSLFKVRSHESVSTELVIYGIKKQISYLCVDLFWPPIRDKTRFVLVKDGNEPFILMCSHLGLSPEEIILAYSYRFKIEVTFKWLKNLLGAFCYHFWTSAMPKLQRKLKTSLTEVKEKALQVKIAKTATAIEAFVNFGCIALGIVQILAAKYSNSIWAEYTGWLRTKTNEIPSEEVTINVIWTSFYHNFLSFSRSAISKIIRSRQRDRLRLYGEGAA